MTRRNIGTGRFEKVGTAKSKGRKKLGQGRVTTRKPQKRRVKVKNLAYSRRKGSKKI